jgi:hypothetical protein
MIYLIISSSGICLLSIVFLYLSLPFLLKLFLSLVYLVNLFDSQLLRKLSAFVILN